MDSTLQVAVITFVLTNLMWAGISVFVYYVVVKREIFHSEYFKDKQREMALTQSDMLDRFMHLIGTLSEYQDIREKAIPEAPPKPLTPEEQQQLDEQQAIDTWLNSRGIVRNANG